MGVNLEKLTQTHRKFTNGNEIQQVKVTEYDGKFYVRLNRNKNISTANGSGRNGAKKFGITKWDAVRIGPWNNF